MSKSDTESTGLSIVIQEIKEILESSRDHVARQVNRELLNTYWNIGRIIDRSGACGLWKADLEGIVPCADERIWKRLFTLQSPEYEGALSGL